jgi:hypothetical protein
LITSFINRLLIQRIRKEGFINIFLAQWPGIICQWEISEKYLYQLWKISNHKKYICLAGLIHRNVLLKSSRVIWTHNRRAYKYVPAIYWIIVHRHSFCLGRTYFSCFLFLSPSIYVLLFPLLPVFRLLCYLAYTMCPFFDIDILRSVYTNSPNYWEIVKVGLSRIIHDYIITVSCFSSFDLGKRYFFSFYCQFLV